MGVFSLDQAHYRWRKDGDALNSDFNWYAAEDTPIDWSWGISPQVRVRFAVQETGNGTGSATSHIEFRVNGGSWTDVGASTAVYTDNADGYSDGDPVTSAQLGVGTGDFVNGEGDEAHGQTGSISFGKRDYTEHEFCISTDDTVLSPGDVIELRLTDNGTPYAAYSQYPTLRLLPLPERPKLSPARIWAKYVPEPMQRAFRPVAAILFPTVATRRGRVSAYELETPDPLPTSLFARRPSPANLWSHFAPALYTSVLVASALAPAGYPPDIETVQRPPSPVVRWSSYAPEPLQLRPQRPLPALFEVPADRRARISAFEQEAPDEHPPWRAGTPPSVLWKHYLPPTKPIFRPPVLIDHLDDNRAARVSAFEQQIPDHFPESLYQRAAPATKPALARHPQRRPIPVDLLAPVGNRRARVSAFEQQVPDPFPGALTQRRVRPALRWDKYAPVSITSVSVIGGLLPAPDNQARVSAFEFQVTEPLPDVLAARITRPARLWLEYQPEPLRLPSRPALVDLLDDNRTARVSAFEQQVPDEPPPKRGGIPLAVTWNEYTPAPFRPGPKPTPVFIFGAPVSTKARISAYELQAPDAFPAVLTKRIERPVRQWDEYAPILLTPVRVVAALHEVLDVKARISAYELQLPESVGDRLARISAFEVEVVEPLPDALSERRVSPVSHWDEYTREELVPRTTLILAIPSRRVLISAFEQEAPEAGVRATISAFEQEVPVADRTARVSAYELEAPLRNQNVRVSAYEQEVPIFEQGARISAFEQEVPLWSQEVRVSAFEQEVPAVGRARVSAYEFTPDADLGPVAERRRFAAIFFHWWRGG